MWTFIHSCSQRSCTYVKGHLRSCFKIGWKCENGLIWKVEVRFEPSLCYENLHPIYLCTIRKHQYYCVSVSDIIENRMTVSYVQSWMLVPFTCHTSQCLAPKCFLLKINILGGSFHLSLFPVLFGSKVLSAQNNILGGSLHFLWFPVLFGSNVFSTQNSTFQMVPFTFMVPVLFNSNVFSAQNQYFWWFNSLFMVLCVV